MVEKTSDIRVLASELVKRMNEERRRVRFLEQRIDRIELSMSSMEETINAQLKNLKAGSEKISSNIKEISDKLLTLETSIKKISKELDKRATKTELKQLESYIGLMSPITAHFVTKEELERILEEKFGKKM